MLTNFRILETKQFQDDLQQDFEGQRSRILDKLKTVVYPQLRENPFVGPQIKKLKNYRPSTWRYRIQHIRFFYEIDDDSYIISMIAATARKDAYTR